MNELEVRRRAYGIFYDLYPDDDPEDMEAAGREVWEAVVASYPAEERRALQRLATFRAGLYYRSARRITLLLTDQRRYSPWVDWTAVRQALAFRHEVYKALSELEREVVRMELALAPDTWRGFRQRSAQLADFGPRFPGRSALAARGGRERMPAVEVVDASQHAAWRRLTASQRLEYQDARDRGRTRLGLPLDQRLLVKKSRG